MIKISSKYNNKLKDLIRIRDDSKYRKDKSLFYVEGENIIKDVPIELFDSLYIREDCIDKFNYIIDKLKFLDNNIYILDNNSFDKIKDTKNSQGIIALLKFNLIIDIDKIINNVSNCLILDRIQDPGNLGTILRTAEATNIQLLILNNCCDIYNTKVIRSSMSSLFRLNIFISKDILKDIQILKNKGFNIFASILDRNANIYNKIKFNKFALIMGNESNGIDENIINVVDKKIYIPMCGNIESLNVSVATSIICYEAMIQNKFYET